MPKSIILNKTLAIGDGNKDSTIISTQESNYVVLAVSIEITDSGDLRLEAHRKIVMPDLLIHKSTSV